MKSPNLFSPSQNSAQCVRCAFLHQRPDCCCGWMPVRAQNYLLKADNPQTISVILCGTKNLPHVDCLRCRWPRSDQGVVICRPEFNVFQGNRLHLLSKTFPSSLVLKTAGTTCRVSCIDLLTNSFLRSSDYWTRLQFRWCIYYSKPSFNLMTNRTTLLCLLLDTALEFDWGHIEGTK